MLKDTILKRIYKYAMLAVLVGGAAFWAVPKAKAVELDVEEADSAAYAGDKDQLKTVTGTVTGKDDAPLGAAVVYLKNTKTLAVKSFIADDGGNFRFHALSPNVDYEVYAEKGGQRSNVKTVSSFDSRTDVTVKLTIK